MTHDEAYERTVATAFQSQFGELVIAKRDGMTVSFMRVSGKPLKKKHVQFLDGLTVGFWSRHKPELPTKIDEFTVRHVLKYIHAELMERSDSSGPVRHALSKLLKGLMSSYRISSL